jgi:hypothetical protein
MKVRADVSVSLDSDPSMNERSAAESNASDSNETGLIPGNDGGKGFLSIFSKFGRLYSDSGENSRFDFAVVGGGGRCG